MTFIKKWLQIICELLELAAALFVLAGIIVSIISLLRENLHLHTFAQLLDDITTFRHYMEKVFVIVIGIEFLEMLCRPNADNVIQVLVFLVARHMIVSDTSPLENLISVISICLLYVLRKHLHTDCRKDRPDAAPSSERKKNIDFTASDPSE